MEKLKVGDVVYSYINNGTTLIMSGVDRLTNNWAILFNGDRLRNVPYLSSSGRRIYYNSVGRDFHPWYQETDLLKENYIIQRKKNKASVLVNKINFDTLNSTQLDQLIELLTSFNQ